MNAGPGNFLVASLMRVVRRRGQTDAHPQDINHRRLLRSVPTADEIYSPAPATDAARRAEDAEERAEAEKRFFYSLRLKNGTRKFTYDRRLDDLNALVNELLPAGGPLRIMDVGISSGITTLEWLEALRRAGVNCRMVAGDSTLEAFILSLGGRLRVLADAGGYPLQFDLFGKAIPNPPGRRNTVLYFLPLLLIKTALRFHVARARRGGAEPGRGQRRERPVAGCRPVRLVSPRAEWPSNVEFVEDDILSNRGLRRQFHALRAANVLNRVYFDEETLTAMLRNLRDRLLTGGLLILCKTDEGDANHATVFVLREDEGLHVAARLGRGSDLEDLVLRLNRRPHTPVSQ